jgi:hypothetical protein
MSLSTRASPNGQTFRLNAKSDDAVFYLLVVAAVSIAKMPSTVGTRSLQK